MQLTVNGQPRQTDEGQTVRGLIHELGLTGRAVAVEVNKKIVPRKTHDAARLAPGDVVEVVTLVGGG